MKIDYYKIPETVVVIRNWYTDEELLQVWEELNFICDPKYLQNEEQTKSAFDETNTYIKKGHGLFLDNLYEDRMHYVILQLNAKIFNPDLLNALIGLDPNFTHLKNCTKDSTLVNYYEDKHEYKKHYDNTVFTCCTPLWKEPKQFDGGVFLITEDDIDLKINSNDMIIFPGYIKHQVTPITMVDGYAPWKSGRYSIANFINYN